MPRRPRAVPAAHFKTHCLGLMDDVQRTGQEIIITKHGKPVARLVPVDDTMPSAYGWLDGTVAIHGDIVGPDPENWEWGADPLDE